MDNISGADKEDEDSNSVAPPLSANLFYGTGQLTISVFFQVSSLILLPFMTNILAIPAGLAGLAIMIPKTSAIFMDPIFGILSERISEKWRQRRVFLVGGGIVVAVCVLAIFRPPPSSNPLLLCAYVFVGFFMANAALSALTVSYLAAASDIANSSSSRTVLSSWRVAFHMTGVLVGGLAPAGVQYFGGGRSGYESMAVALCIFCLTAVLINYQGVRNIPVQRQQTEYASIGDLLRVLVEPSFFRSITHIYSLKYFANGIQYSATAYFTIFILEGSLTLLSGMVVSMTVAALLSQPLWVRLAAWQGRKLTFIIATIGIGASFLSFGALQSGQFVPAYIISVAQGIFAGGGALMSWSLFLEAIERHKVTSGSSRAELLSGVWSAVEKASFAIGVFCFGGILQVLGLISSTSTDVVQPDSALFGIRLGMAVLPCIGMALTVVLIYKTLEGPDQAETRTA